MARPAGRWAFVSCAGGPFVLAWVDARRWKGWVVPWFLDTAFGAEELRAYWCEDPEHAPSRTQSGRWEYRDDDGEVVELDRVRKIVDVGKGRVPLALTDAREMDWCWEVMRFATPGELAELFGDEVQAEAAARGRKGGKP